MRTYHPMKNCKDEHQIVGSIFLFISYLFPSPLSHFLSFSFINNNRFDLLEVQIGFQGVMNMAGSVKRALIVGVEHY